jgi:predicted O-methyltransferase YrrM
MDIVHPELNRYMLNIIPPRDEVLQEMEDIAKKNGFPIIGPLVGRLLYQIALITKPKRIFEMGSGYGYSAYWFAKATPNTTKIICTDGSEENAKTAKEFFKRGKINKKIEFKVGNALEIIDRTPGKFDIIFNDIDKEQYPEAFYKAVAKLKKGGLFISDNVLWSGKILDKEIDEATMGIIKFNDLIYTSKELFTTIIPIRDGVSVCVKIK